MMPVWLMSVAAALRLVILFLVSRHPAAAINPDSVGYLQLAQNLWHHGAFSVDLVAPFHPDTFRTGGYPLFLLPFVIVFKNPILPIAIVQTLFSFWTVLIAWRWFVTISDQESAQWGALFLAMDPVILLHGPLILGETLFLWLITLAAERTWNILRGSKTQQTIQAGLLWGLSALVRPVSLYLPAVLALLPERRKIGALLLIVSYILPGLWIIRNMETVRLPSFSSMGGIHLLICFAAGTEAMRTHQPYTVTGEVLENRVLQEHPQGFQSDIERSQVYKNAALPILKAHPFYMLEYCLWGALKTLSGNGFELIIPLVTSQTLQDQPNVQAKEAIVTGQGTRLLLRKYPVLIPFFVIYMLLLGILYLGFFLGLWSVLKKRNYREAIYLAMAAAYFLFATSHAGYYRHRISMMPFLAAGLVLYLHHRKNETRLD